MQSMGCKCQDANITNKIDSCIEYRINKITKQSTIYIIEANHHMDKVKILTNYYTLSNIGNHRNVIEVGKMYKLKLKEFYIPEKNFIYGSRTIYILYNNISIPIDLGDKFYTTDNIVGLTLYNDECNCR